MQVAAVICPNGLGHFKRMIGLLWELKQQWPELEMDIFCESWQVERSRGWSKHTLFEAASCRLHTDILHAGVYLDYYLPHFDDGRLISWEQRLALQPAIQQADLVLSDNLVGVLSVREDALLVGSFFWSEVFAVMEDRTSSVERFIEHERRLLKKYRPPMLCVEAVATPGVQQLTEKIGLPWFGSFPVQERDTQKRTGRIGLLGGATGQAERRMLLMIEDLLKQSSFEIALSPGMRKRFEGHAQVGRLVVFDFSPQAFASCDLMICRPGIGTVTDCLVTRTPMLLFSERPNFELDYNREQLVALGVAEALPEKSGTEVFLKKTMQMLEESRYAGYIQKMRTIRTDGFAAAAAWIRSYLN